MEMIDFSFDVFQQIIGALVNNHITDIHITPGSAPYIREAKKLKELRLPMVDDETGEQLLVPFRTMKPADTHKFAVDLITYANKDNKERTEQLIEEIEKEEVDTTLSIPKVSRFRVHISLQRSSVTCSIRVVPDKVPNLEGFPREIRNFEQYHSGLIIVSGKTNSGKSTTLAMLIDEMNKTQARKIITLEDPIEYLHRHNHSLIVQREIGIDTENYKTGLLSSLREDPDVLVIGELRDVDSFEIALNAAESGCLVLTTMHSADARETIERIISMFPDDKQNQIKSQLATVLKGIVCQQLIPAQNYSSPLVAAFEILTTNPAVQNAIRKGDFHSIPNIIETNKKNNMRSMKDSLQKLKEAGIISEIDWFNRDSLINND